MLSRKDKRIMIQVFANEAAWYNLRLIHHGAPECVLEEMVMDMMHARGYSCEL